MKKTYLIIGVLMAVVLGLLVLVQKEPGKVGITPEVTLVSETMVGDNIYERVYEVQAERQLTARELYALSAQFIREFEIENPNCQFIEESYGAQVGELSRFWFRYEIVS